ncbi:MAG: hypothetical protein HYZ37_10135 [Candidatus Solibacter usitatus]|nr:hypothetical protein [Candidatus Solibacter usitatus]
MGQYISTLENRHYTAVESTYGTTPVITGANRFLAAGVQIRQEHAQPARRDKSGSRSVNAIGGALRRSTKFAVKSYLTARSSGSVAPAQGVLLECAMGGEPRVFAGGNIDSMISPTRMRLTAAHGLSVGQGVAFGGEIRFVTGVVDTITIDISSEFSIVPSNGSVAGGTVSYGLGRRLKSMSLFDYWSPDSALQRIARGAVVDRMKVELNGDLHEMEFRGEASDVTNSASQVSGFPVEPALSAFNERLVAGHLGQAWLGSGLERFFTISGASILLENGVDMRNREFGSAIPLGYAAGKRAVTMRLALYGKDDAATTALYGAAADRQSVPVMMQLGDRPGEMMGIHMPHVIPSIPEFDDKETRLQWQFDGCLAHGGLEDEMYISFG